MNNNKYLRLTRNAINNIIDNCNDNDFITRLQITKNNMHFEQFVDVNINEREYKILQKMYRELTQIDDNTLLYYMLYNIVRNYYN